MPTRTWQTRGQTCKMLGSFDPGPRSSTRPPLHNPRSMGLPSSPLLEVPRWGHQGQQLSRRDTADRRQDGITSTALAAPGTPSTESTSPGPRGGQLLPPAANVPVLELPRLGHQVQQLPKRDPAYCHLGLQQPTLAPYQLPPTLSPGLDRTSPPSSCMEDSTYEDAGPLYSSPLPATHCSGSRGRSTGLASPGPSRTPTVLRRPSCLPSGWDPLHSTCSTM